MTILKSALILILAHFGAASIASAQTDSTSRSTYPRAMPSGPGSWAPHIGVLAGLSSPEGSYDSTGAIGLNMGFQPFIPIGLGAEITYSRAQGDGNNEALERTQVLGTGTYNFGGDNFLVKYSYIGLGLGVAFQSSETDFVTAPMIGFDIPIWSFRENPLTLGANARYAILEGRTPDTATINGELKVWY